MTTDTLLGRRLGGFDVREVLGIGGMASVYKGYDPALDREVAIKIIGTAGQSPDFVARFQREARVVAKLRHPHIVQIYQFGEEQGFVYMVQELLAGPTLQRRMRDTRRRMARDRVQETIAQLAAALDFAHGQGVFHRDVKPSNALYNAQGLLVLTDFGIARSEADAQRSTTGPGVVMGTPAYLAPEQAVSSAALTPACDIYALGVVLFELLTGRLPFEGATPMSIILKHLYDDPPKPSGLRGELPHALDAVVLRALEKEPRKRYASAGALARALGEAWPAETPPSRSARRATPPAGAVTTPKLAKTTPALPETAAKPKTPRPVAKPAAPAKAAPRKPRAAAPTPASAAPKNDPWPLRIGMVTLIVLAMLLITGYNRAFMLDTLNGLRGLVGR